MSGFTLEHYQALCSAIARGVTSIEVNGRKITYRKLSDMLRIKAMAEAELGMSGSGGQSRQHYPAFSKE